MAIAKNQRGKGMLTGWESWLSLEAATGTAYWANIFFVISLVVGVACTILIIGTNNVKEWYWDRDRLHSSERIIELDVRGKQLERDTAEANSRAAEANRIAEGERLSRLKLEREMAWRSLNVEQKAKVVESAKPFAGQMFDLITYQDDPEAINFANVIGHALLEAGWKLKPPSAFLAFKVELGVKFDVAPSQEQQLSPAVMALVSACLEAGIAALAGVNAGYEKDSPEIIRIRVGKKPERAR